MIAITKRQRTARDRPRRNDRGVGAPEFCHILRLRLYQNGQRLRRIDGAHGLVNTYS